MKKILVLTVLLVNIIYAQIPTKDVSKIVLQTMKNISGIDFYGACVDAGGTVHITLGYNSTWVMIATGNGFSMKDVCFNINANAMFKTAQKLFKQFPECQTIKMYFVDINELYERDQYGNPIKEKKKIMFEEALTRETSKILNWEYIDSIVNTFMTDPQQTLKYLDKIKINSVDVTQYYKK